MRTVFGCRKLPVKVNSVKPERIYEVLQIFYESLPLLLVAGHLAVALPLVTAYAYHYLEIGILFLQVYDRLKFLRMLNHDSVTLVVELHKRIYQMGEHEGI